MRDGSIRILTGRDVIALLDGRETDIMDAVRLAYEAHARSETSLPHSTFLRFPDNDRNRIIALPAYLGGDFRAAGVKWVSSFPANIKAGMDRASAVTILNSAETGRPETIMEGSVISAKRTAASAALASQLLRTGEKVDRAGIVGCGLINFEVARFLSATLPTITRFIIFDLDKVRARQFRKKCVKSFGKEVTVANESAEIFEDCELISFATTATSPYVFDLSACAPNATILHVSLRDLSPEVILSCDNVVDDVDHVCRAQTSVHLAEQLTGDRNFIRCTLGDILLGSAPARAGSERVTVFSPFGLGILDIAVSQLVQKLADQQGIGQVIESFLPAPWAKQG